MRNLDGQKGQNEKYRHQEENQEMQPTLNSIDERQISWWGSLKTYGRGTTCEQN